MEQPFLPIVQSSMLRIGYLGALAPTMDDGVSRSMVDFLRAAQRLGAGVFVHSVMHNNPEALESRRRSEELPPCRFEEEWMVHQGFEPAAGLLRFAVTRFPRHQVLGGHPEVVRAYVASLADVRDAYVLSCDWGVSSLLSRVVAGLPGGHVFHSPEAIRFWRKHPRCCAASSRVMSLPSVKRQDIWPKKTWRSALAGGRPT